jgi:fatty acid desaturase
MASDAAQLGGIHSASLVDGRGITYLQLRATLRPRWLRVTGDLLLGYLALVLVAWASLAMEVTGMPWVLPGALLCAVAFGYWLAYLQLFLHEAAHYNIAASRRWNDWLANLLVASWVGTSIGAYRIIHWQHHRLHGLPEDTEHSYFSPLNRRFIIESLTGIGALRVLRSRNSRLRSSARPATAGARLMPSVAVLLHGTLVAAAFATGHGWTGIAWLAGVGVFFPFFGALRQLLEHRSVRARADVDYSVTPHGATTRMFREGPLGSTFGAAGFTRHLLHHWDPSVSYTNLAQVERFLRDCQGVPRRALRKTSYGRAFRALYGRP